MLSKITTNKAARNDIELDIFENDDERASLWITKSENQEPDFIYYVNDDGSFQYKNSLTGDSDDMPAYIENEQHLRNMIPEISKLLQGR